MPTISVNTVTWNEASTIDLALKSVVDFADEVILVDNGSTDKTVEIACECFKKYDLNGKIYEKQLLLADSRFFAVKHSSGDWICILDGDHVLNTSSSQVSFKDLKALAEENKKVCYRFRYVQLYGDFRHAFKKYPLAPPHVVLFKNTPGVHKARRRLNLPEFNYPEVRLNQVIGANLTGCKPALRMYVRRFFNQWQHDKRYGTPLEYLIATKGKVNLEETARKWMIQRLQNICVKIEDVFQHGVKVLPKIVREELEHPRYELIYKNGKIVGRKPDILPEEYK